MAHYARLNERNIVDRVVVIGNDMEPTEQAGVDYCRSLFGGGTWKKTSYNGTIRKRFAAIGHTYDYTRDAFIPQRPYYSWQFDEATCGWVAPVAKPDDGMWVWDEYTTSWRQRA